MKRQALLARFRSGQIRGVEQRPRSLDAAVCSENLIRVDEVKESPKLTE
jgi:hypothetical protein